MDFGEIDIASGQYILTSLQYESLLRAGSHLYTINDTVRGALSQRAGLGESRWLSCVSSM